MPRWGHNSNGSLKVRKNERGGGKRGEKISFPFSSFPPCRFFFSLSSSRVWGGKKEKTHPPVLQLSLSLSTFKSFDRPCSAAVLLSSSTASGCSLRGPRPRASRSSTGGSRRRSGTSTGDEEERSLALLPPLSLSLSFAPCFDLYAALASSTCTLL